MSTARDISIGRVIDRTLRTFRTLAAPAILTILLLSALPEMAVAWVKTEQPLGAFQMFALDLLVWLPLILAQASIVHAALQVQAGRTIPFVQSLRAALGRYLHVLGIAILTGIGVLIGVFFLIIPGLYLATLWCVAIPAQMSRREGILESINESGDLTEGRRWKVLAACVIGMVVIIVPALAIYLLSSRVAFFSGPVVDMILPPLVNALGYLVLTFGAAALYHELRWRDGGRSEDSTASVFD